MKNERCCDVGIQMRSHTPPYISRATSLRTASPPCDNRHISAARAREDVMFLSSAASFCLLEIAMDNGYRRSKKRPLKGKGVLATLLSIPLLSSVVSAHAPVYFGSPSRDSPLVPPQIPLVGSPSSPETHEFVRMLFISLVSSLANHISLYLVASSHLPPRNA